MIFPLEYHKFVNRSTRSSIPASLALFGMFLLPLFLVSSSSAQISGGSAQLFRLRSLWQRSASNCR